MFCAAAAAAACSNGDSQQNRDQNPTVEGPLPGGIPEDAEVETLPADESSTTSSGELENGFVAPDANDSEPTNAH